MMEERVVLPGQVEPITGVREPADAGGHIWRSWSAFVACANCGFVRRADGKNKPCRGAVRLALRQATASPSSPNVQGPGKTTESNPQ